MRHLVKLENCKVKLYGYNANTPIKVLGKFTETIQTKKRYAVAEFYVVQGESGSLINADTATSLSLIKFTNKIDDKRGKDDYKESLVNKYPEVFNDKIGKMKNVQIKLHIDKDVKPIVQQCRRVPLPLRGKVEAELERLEDAGVIEKVEGPTEWVSPIVIQPKRETEEIRICTDMREANKAIKRTRHTIPTIEEIRHRLNGAKYYTKIDLKNAYHQLELCPESRNITTFTTHKGLRRNTRLNFGTNSAAELFHEEIRKKLADIFNCFNIYDDILVYGCMKEEHDTALTRLLERLKEIGITANIKKCVFVHTS